MSKTGTALKVMPTAELPQPKYDYQAQSVSSAKIVPTAKSAAKEPAKSELQSILRNLKL